MTVQTYDFSLKQGADLSFIVFRNTAGVAVDLTGYTVRGQIRRTTSSALVVDLTCTIPTPSNGRILVGLTAAQTAAIEMDRSDQAKRKITYFTYDIELIDPSGVVVRILEGVIAGSPEATK